jgi:hypothetical protein
MELKKLKVGELKLICKDKGIKQFSKKPKPELIDELTEKFSDLSFITDKYIASLVDAKPKKAADTSDSEPVVRTKTLSKKLEEYIDPANYKDQFDKLDDTEFEAMFNIVKGKLPDFITSENVGIDDYKKYINSKDWMKITLDYEKKNTLSNKYEERYAELAKFAYKQEIKKFVSTDAKDKPVYYALLKKFKNAAIKNKKPTKAKKGEEKKKPVKENTSDVEEEVDSDN